MDTLLIPTEPPSAPTSISSTLIGVPAGGSTSLTCNHDNTGSFTYVWSKDGYSLAETSSVLSLSSFTLSDGGVYTCAIHVAPLSSDPASITIVFAGLPRQILFTSIR